MSDQHKGLIEAVKDVMPYAEHRQCARHIYESFRKRFTGVHFRSLFWQASKASYPQLFDRVMKEIRLCDPAAAQYLLDKNPKTWSRAFFKLGRACDSVENGFSECFNSVILTVRNKPIITLFESIRVIILERQSVMRELCQRWPTDISPSIIARLNWVKDQQRFWKPFHCGGNDWEVRQLNEAFKVNDAHRHCSCRVWELSGVPCPHACSVIFKLGRNPEDYLPGWFTRPKYTETYSTFIMHVRGMSQWVVNEQDKPLPPHPRVMPGRPKKKRRRAAHEGGVVRATEHFTRVSRSGIVMTCRKCGEKGHNKRMCKNEEVPQPTKQSKPSGRPRKDGTDPHVRQSTGTASVNLNGAPIAQASVQVGSHSRGEARVNVGGTSGYQASVSLNGIEGTQTQTTPSQARKHPSTPLQEYHDGQAPTTPIEETQSTPLTTQESQTTPPILQRAPTKPPRWTKCKILAETLSPMKGTSAGPIIKPLRADNVVMGSQSVITKSSVGLGVTSVGFQKVKTRGPVKFPTWWGAGLCIDPVTNETYVGGSDSIPVPIWPKDVPLPSASEEWARKQRATEAVKKKVAEVAREEALASKGRMSTKAATEGSLVPRQRLVTPCGSSSQQDAQKKRAVEGVKRVIAETSGKNSGTIPNDTGSDGSNLPKAASVMTQKVAGPSSQPRKATLPLKRRAPSERILHKKLAKKFEGPGSTPDSALEL